MVYARQTIDESISEQIQMKTEVVCERLHSVVH